MIMPALSNGNHNNNLHQFQRLDTYQQQAATNELEHQQHFQHPQQESQHLHNHNPHLQTQANQHHQQQMLLQAHPPNSMNQQQQISSSVKHEFEVTDMEANNIDENMTVPHPSRYQHNSYAVGGQQLQQQDLQLQQHSQHQHHQQAYHHQQDQLQSQLIHQQQHYHLPCPQQHHQVHQHQQQQQFDQYLQPANNQSANEKQAQQQLHDPILEQLTILVQETHKIEQLVKESRDTHQESVLQLQTRNRLLTVMNYHERRNDHSSTEKARRDLEEFEKLFRQGAIKLNEGRLKLMSDMRKVFEQMSYIQTSVLYEHIPGWQQDQQLANNNAKLENAPMNALDEIQIWVEKLIDITCRLRNQLKNLHHILTQKSVVPFKHFEELKRFGLQVDRSLEALILRTFVVEKQPPQVMKTNTRFTSTVRFLSGAKLNVQMTNPTVRVTILSENNARAIIQRHQELIQSSWSYLDCPPVATVQPPPQPPISGNQSQSGAQAIAVAPPQQHPAQIPQVAHLNSYQPTTQDQMSTCPSPNSPQNLVAPSPSPSSVSQQQHQFFQQQQHQFLVQQASPSPQHQHQQQKTAPSPQYHHAPPGNIAAYHQQPLKTLNVNDFDPSGEILNSSNILEYQENTNQLICHFRNMQLKKIKRTEKKGTESVMDEKFVLLFHTDFRIAGDTSCSNTNDSAQVNNSHQHWIKQGDMSFHIMAFSLPVVVIVHGNQEPHAWATVTWHNAFARPDEILYQVPDKVTWLELGQVLSDKFKSCAGKGLSEHQLDYLATKVYRNRVDNNEVHISWNQFAKETLAEKSFTFWEWFHSILKLTKEHLRDLWNADRIYGFVDKKGCVDLLLGSNYHEPTPVGTFLLRYSETELGGITIAWVSSSSSAAQQANPNNSSSNKNGTSGCIQMIQRHSPTNHSTTSSSNVLMHLQPFVSKDLNTRSLADRIRDLEDLIYLFPDIPKNDAFKDYYTPFDDTTLLSNGYIRPMLVQKLVANYPKNSNSVENAVTPATPSSFSLSSPDGIYQDNAFMNDMDTNYATYD